MSAFRKNEHGLLGRKVLAIDFDTEEDRDRAFHLLKMIEKLVGEAHEEGYAVEELREEGMVGHRLAVFDYPHAKASALGVAKMRGDAAASTTSGKILLNEPLDLWTFGP